MVAGGVSISPGRIRMDPVPGCLPGLRWFEHWVFPRELIRVV